MKFNTRVGDYQRARADRLRGQADLVYVKGVFFLIAVVDAPEASEYDSIDTLGIDFGIENIVVDSDNQVFESKKVEKTRQRYNKLRRGLQKTESRSAKRKLKKISGKERRFKRDTNHVISKAIVSKAKGTTRAIAIEDLKNIRSRVTVNGSKRQNRDRHSKWAFGQLRSFVTYKAKKEGVPLKVVNPYNTSRECPKCHNVDARNRRTRNDFQCLECGYQAMADYVAACNIAAKGRVAVNQPIVAPLFCAVTSPLSSDGGS